MATRGPPNFFIPPLLSLYKKIHRIPFCTDSLQRTNKQRLGQSKAPCKLRVIKTACKCPAESTSKRQQFQRRPGQALWCKNYEFSQQGALKRTGVGGKGRLSHTEEAYNWCPHPCTGDCVRVFVRVCGTQAGKEKEGQRACVCEGTHLSAPEAPSVWAWR